MVLYVQSPALFDSTNMVREKWTMEPRLGG
jgi:hypothetical protein